MIREDKKQNIPSVFKVSVASNFICYAVLLQLCFMKFKFSFFIVLLVTGKCFKMGAFLARRVCMTFYVLQVTIPCVCEKKEDLKLSPVKGDGIGALLCFWCRSDSLSNSKKLQSQMQI